MAIYPWWKLYFDDENEVLVKKLTEKQEKEAIDKINIDVTKAYTKAAKKVQGCSIKLAEVMEKIGEQVGEFNFRKQALSRELRLVTLAGNTLYTLSVFDMQDLATVKKGSGLGLMFDPADAKKVISSSGEKEEEPKPEPAHYYNKIIDRNHGTAGSSASSLLNITVGSILHILKNGNRTRNVRGEGQEHTTEFGGITFELLVGGNAEEETLAKEFKAIFEDLKANALTHSECIYEADMAFRKELREIADLAEVDETLMEKFLEAAGTKEKDALDKAAENLDIAEFEEFVTTLETATKILFKEQCWLLSYVGQLAEFKKKVLDPRNEETTTEKRLPYQAAPIPSAGTSANATLLVDGDPYAFINKLTIDPATGILFDIENSDLSKLQPRIRLFKTYYDEGEDIKEVEISFDSYHSPITDALKDTIGRGVGVGISSFNFAYDGSNPFSIKKSITGNLKIFANSLKDLFVVRGEGGEKWRYTDLAMKTGDISKAENSCTSIDDENSRLRTLNFRLRAQVGLSELTGGGNTNLNTALREAYVTLNLTPTVHNFEIDEQGRVIFNINFLSYIEEFFDDSTYNVFANSRTSSNQMTAMSRFKRKVEIEYLLKTCGREKSNEAEKNFEGEISEETAVSITAIIETLMNDDKIFYINLDQEQIKSFTSVGPFKITDKESVQNKIKAQIDRSTTPTTTPNTASKDYITGGADSQEDLNERLAIVEEIFSNANEGEKTNIAKALAAGGNPNEMVISYFYVSDLIDTILANIDSELSGLVTEVGSEVKIASLASDDLAKKYIASEVLKKKGELTRHQNNFKKLRILLGPTELFTDRQSEIDPGTSINVNLGDIPISVKYFLEWITDKMLKKREVVYPLTKFLNDLFNDLVKSFLNNDSCFGYSVKQKTRIGQATLTSTGVGGGDTDERIMSQLNYTSATRLDLAATEPPILKLSGHSGARTKVNIDEEYNYFVFYASRIQPTEKMNGKRGQDATRGIFHYTMGRSKGIIKSIKMTKTQTPGLAEVRFEQEGFDGLTQLRVIYDVQIDTFANVNSFPGTYIYVDPQGFVPSGIDIPDSDLTYSDLGIGGYYMIIKSEHEFGPGYANTSIHARWVNSIEKSQQENCVISSLDDSDSAQNTKCKVRE